MAGQRLVDGVVDHLVDHVVQAGAVIGVADIHAGRLRTASRPLSTLMESAPYSDMTELTFDILSATLFSGHVAGSEEEFAGDIERLLSTMGRVDPMDLLKAPRWIPRIRRMFGQKVLDKFRAIVKQTMDDRQKMMRDQPEAVPEDFLTLLIRLASSGRTDIG
jgi:hypothetical protein